MWGECGDTMENVGTLYLLHYAVPQSPGTSTLNGRLACAGLGHDLLIVAGENVAGVVRPGI